MKMSELIVSVGDEHPSATVLQFPRERIVRDVPQQQQPLKASEPLDWLNAFFEQASVAPWYQEWVEKWYGGGERKL